MNDAFIEQLKGCNACALREHASQVVPGWGNEQGKYVIVGEAPGRNEDEQGIPFVGRSGEMLREYLALSGIDISECYITNVAKCWPPLNSARKQKAPTSKQIKLCASLWLDAEIERIDPKVIIALGAVASMYLTGEKVSEAHGRIVEGVGGRPVAVMYHPAAGMHDPRLSSIIRADFERLANVIQGSPASRPSWKLITTMKGLLWVVEQVRNAPLVAVDFETTDVRPFAAEIVGIALAWKPTYGVYIPIQHPDVNVGVPAKTVLEMLKLDQRQVVAHNAKFELSLMKRAGVDVNGLLIDCTMVMAALLCRPTKGLKALALSESNVQMNPIESVIGSGVHQVTMDLVPAAMAAEYACPDATMAFNLLKQFTAEMDVTTKWVYDEVEWPLIPIVAKMEQEGFALSRKAIDEAKRVLDEKFEELLSEIRSETGDETFNPISPIQVVQALGLRNAQAETLRTAGNPLATKIADAKHLNKLRTSYIENIERMWPRAMLSFNQVGTAIGRFSSSAWKVNGVTWGINAQTLPKPKPWEDGETAESLMIRRCFEADEGYVLVEGDVSQADLRLAAHISGDELMIEAYQGGRDLHSEFMRETKITDRRLAKIINFATLYEPDNQKAAAVLKQKALESGVKISAGDAARMIAAKRVAFPGLVRYYGEIYQQIARRGYVETVTGRRMKAVFVPGRSDNAVKANLDTWRSAINMPISGSVADLIKIALISMDREVPEFVRYKLTVHDSLVVQTKIGTEVEVGAWLKKHLKSALTLSVPVEVDLSVGLNLGEMKKLSC